MKRSNRSKWSKDVKISISRKFNNLKSYTLKNSMEYYCILLGQKYFNNLNKIIYKYCYRVCSKYLRSKKVGKSIGLEFH